MFGLTGDKLIVIAVIAVFVVGPERLPRLASQLAQLVKRVRTMSLAARDRVEDELGEEFDHDAWKKLDPRQYDPRRIIRDALAESESERPPKAESSA